MNLLEKEDLIRVQAEELEHASAEEVIEFAIKTFPNITFACFGAEDVVLVDMIQKISPSTDILSGYRLSFQGDIRNAGPYGRTLWLEFVRVSPLITPEEQAAQHGEALWSVSPNECRNIRKVEPLTRILSQYEAWITGIRRDQAPTRANSKKIEYDTKFGLVKFNPIAGWTSEDVWNYIRTNEIIYNPRDDQNYPSIGRILHAAGHAGRRSTCRTLVRA